MSEIKKADLSAKDSQPSINYTDQKVITMTNYIHKIYHRQSIQNSLLQNK